MISTLLKCTWYFKWDVCQFIIVFFFSRWNQGIVVLTSLSSLVVPCVVVTTYGATGDDGIVGLTAFCFQCSTNKTSTPHYTDIFSSLKCTWCFVFLFHYAWISSLPYIIMVFFLFSHWKQGIVELATISSLMASWFVVRKIAVPPVGLSTWRSFVFRCSINMIFTPDFTVISTSSECTWYLCIFVYLCFDKLSAISL